jgi:hypothetical protein
MIYLIEQFSPIIHGIIHQKYIILHHFVEF